MPPYQTTGVRSLPRLPLAPPLGSPEFDALVRDIRVGQAIAQAKRDPNNVGHIHYMLWEYIEVNGVIGASAVWREEGGGLWPWETLAEVMEQADSRGLEIVAYYPLDYAPLRDDE